MVKKVYVLQNLCTFFTPDCLVCVCVSGKDLSADIRHWILYITHSHRLIFTETFGKETDQRAEIHAAVLQLESTWLMSQLGQV